MHLQACAFLQPNRANIHKNQFNDPIVYSTKYIHGGKLWSNTEERNSLICYWSIEKFYNTNKYTNLLTEKLFSIWFFFAYCNNQQFLKLKHKLKISLSIHHRLPVFVKEQQYPLYSIIYTCKKIQRTSQVFNQIKDKRSECIFWLTCLKTKRNPFSHAMEVHGFFLCSMRNHCDMNRGENNCMTMLESSIFSS